MENHLGGEDAVSVSTLRVRSSLVSFFCVASPKIAAGALQLVVNWLLIRQLGPANSGVLFSCVTAVVLGDAVIGAALDMGVIGLATGKGGARRSLAVQKSALAAKFAGGILIGLPVLLLARPLAAVLFHGDASPVLLPMSVAALIGLLLLRSVQTCFQVSERFVLYGLTDVLHSSIKFGGIAILLALRTATPGRVLGCFVAGPGLVAPALLLTAARGVLREPFSLEALKDLGRVTKWMLGVGASGSINSRMDILLVSAQAGTVEAGLFSAAQVLTLPFQLLAMYMSVVFAPKILPLWRKGRLAKIYKRFQGALIALALSLYGIAWLAGGRLVAPLLPAAYKASMGILLLLLPSALAAMVNFPWTVSFLMFTHPKWLLLLEASSFPILLVLYRLLIPAHGAAGAALVTSGFAVSKAILYQILASRTMEAGPGKDDFLAAKEEGLVHAS
ncbi:MAG TPA: hypothetical protein VKV17_10525 [Bryobacteraceae bacterium]|nr:hypothetical protein [Bryobacteraceae bacterium]